MIPADVASRMQVSADASLRPVAPAQEITDKLSGLVAGQKVMAEIQSLLPNGTYRAMINQRNITLALPFSAKSGDSLELQVTENDGKLALAVLSRPEGESGKTVRDSASATLSRTGQLISTLFSGAREAKGDPAALSLNGNQAIASAPPATAQDILPLLKQAITQSGMFYESHQAEWVEGRFSKSALLQEPQGKLSSPAAFVAAAADDVASAAALKTPMTSTGEPASTTRLAPDFAQAQSSGSSMEGSKVAPPPQPTQTTGQQTSASESVAKTALPANTEAASTTRPAPDVAQTQGPSVSIEGGKAGSTQQATQSTGQIVAPQTQPIVQQQLDALATQTFVWQGQVWPGQEMRWEIDEDATRRGTDNDDTAGKWATRLHLVLPNLGEIDAKIRLDGNRITLAMSAGSAETRTLIRSSAVALRSQFDEAGLTLASMGVDSVTGSTTDGRAGQ